MSDTRRSVLKLGENLAVDFANTVSAPGAEGALRGWADLVDFLELRGAFTRSQGGELRTMGETDARRCGAAFSCALQFRETVRAMVAAMAAGRPVRASWIREVNQALGWGTGAERLLRDGPGWRLDLVADCEDPKRVLAPLARSLAVLLARGRGGELRKCANPRCMLYFRDTSRTRRRRWCSMAVCGNRMKVAAHARRRHGRPR
jgi:predicted RNA-binding Zn ribbon-like protein